MGSFSRCCLPNPDIRNWSRRRRRSNAPCASRKGVTDAGDGVKRETELPIGVGFGIAARTCAGGD